MNLKFQFFYIYYKKQGWARAVPIEILKIWVPLGTGYRENFKNWVPLVTGYRPEKKFGYRWLPGTGQKNIFGTDGYRVPSKKIFGYRWIPGADFFYLSRPLIKSFN